jgi:hypothetical protein
MKETIAKSSSGLKNQPLDNAPGFFGLLGWPHRDTFHIKQGIDFDKLSEKD